jgi:hypothetical protein
VIKITCYGIPISQGEIDLSSEIWIFDMKFNRFKLVSLLRNNMNDYCPFWVGDGYRKSFTAETFFCMPSLSDDSHSIVE